MYEVWWSIADEVYKKLSTELIPYSGKLSREKTFANFAV